MANPPYPAPCSVLGSHQRFLPIVLLDQLHFVRYLCQEHRKSTSIGDLTFKWRNNISVTEHILRVSKMESFLFFSCSYNERWDDQCVKNGKPNVSDFYCIDDNIYCFVTFVTWYTVHCSGQNVTSWQIRKVTLPFLFSASETRCGDKQFRVLSLCNEKWPHKQLQPYFFIAVIHRHTLALRHQ